MKKTKPEVQLKPDTFSVYNDRTGERIFENVDKVSVHHGHAEKSDKKHSRIFDDKLQDTACLGLTGTELNLLLLCIAFNEFENYVLLDRFEAANLLRVHPEVTRLALKKLIRLGLIYVFKEPHKISRLRINPELSFKGSDKFRKKEVQRLKDQEYQERQNVVVNVPCVTHPVAL